MNLKLKNFDNDAMFVSKLISKLNLIFQKLSVDFLFVQGDTKHCIWYKLIWFFKKYSSYSLRSWT